MLRNETKEHGSRWLLQRLEPCFFVQNFREELFGSSPFDL